MARKSLAPRTRLGSLLSKVRNNRSRTKKTRFSTPKGLKRSKRLKRKK